MTGHTKRVVSKQGLEALARVRASATAHGDVAEAVDKFGHTSFRVRDKPFGQHGWVSLLEVPPAAWTAVDQLKADAYALVSRKS